MITWNNPKKLEKPYITKGLATCQSLRLIFLCNKVLMLDLVVFFYGFRKSNPTGFPGTTLFKRTSQDSPGKRSHSDCWNIPIKTIGFIHLQSGSIFIAMLVYQSVIPCSKLYLSWPYSSRYYSWDYLGFITHVLGKVAACDFTQHNHTWNIPSNNWHDMSRKIHRIDIFTYMDGGFLCVKKNVGK